MSAAVFHQPSLARRIAPVFQGFDGWWNTAADMGADYPPAAVVRQLHGQSPEHRPPSI